MSDLIFTAAYWPFFRTNELRRFDYTVDDGTLPPMTSVFSYDVGSDSMLYSDYDDKGVLNDVWYYQYRVGFGVAEWRDDYPTKSKKIVMSPPIGWGEFAAIGGTYQNSPKMDPFQSWPPAMAQGFQCIWWEYLHDTFTLRDGTQYSDVLQFLYTQSWNGGKASGARYWMALGIGPIAVQWVAQAPDGSIVETSRMDGKLTRFNAEALVA